MSNPIIKRTELLTSATPMTVQGVVKKTALLLGLSSIASIGLFLYGVGAGLSSGMLYVMAIVAGLVNMGLGLMSAFRPHAGKAIAVPYALCEGVLLGAFSLIIYRIYPSVPLTALAATFVTAAIMLGLYTAGIIKVTEKFRSIILSAVAAIAILYLVQIVFRLFGASLPFLFDGGIIAIGFSIFVTIIASFSLLIDFDNVEQSVYYGVDESFEWVHSIGILSTLVWMYVEFLRLLGYLED